MNTKIIAGFDAIQARYDHLIVDLWGVTHNGRALFPAAIQVFEGFKQRGGQVLFLSNAPRRQDSVFEQLSKFGLDKALYDGVVTSGEAAWDWIRSDQGQATLGQNCFHLGAGEKDANMRVGLGVRFVDDLDQASFILNTGPEDAITQLNGFSALIAKGVENDVPMVCANPDLSVFRGAQEELCAGAIAQAYETAGGKVYWFGKPWAEVYQRCENTLNITNRQRVLCIGDSMRTDIRGATDYGFDSLLVGTGLRGEQLVSPETAQISPTGLANLCDEYGISPTYCCVALKP